MPARSPRRFGPAADPAPAPLSARAGDPSPFITRPYPKDPFRPPDDRHLFALRDEQKGRTFRGRASLHDLPTPNTRYRHVAKVDAAAISAEERALARFVSAPDAAGPPPGLRSFVEQERELFMCQLEVDTKLEELQRLEQLEQAEEESLRAKEAEMNLFRDQFRSFLECDGKATMDAKQAADAKARQRQEISARIKLVQTQTATLRTQITLSEDTLQEWDAYKQFLEDLTPGEWRQSHPLPEMYFARPAQLIEILGALQDHNMFLIGHCEEAEEMLARFRERFNTKIHDGDDERGEMDATKEVRRQHVAEMVEQNERYRVEGQFRFGNEIGELELGELKAAIADFHYQIGYDSGSLLDTVTMLRRIERRMDDLTDKLSHVDKKILREKSEQTAQERYDQERAEKNTRDKKEQNEKTQRSIQLAMKPIKKRSGRPTMERMVPTKEESRERKEEALRRRLAREAADADLLSGPLWD